MRTKTLLLAAVLGVATVATSLAQVYSVNVVGYVNVNLVPGYTMIANQLNATGGNTLENIMGDPEIGTTVFKYNGASFDSGSYIGSATWIYSTPAPFGLNPGEGAFVQVTAPKTLTFVGEVTQGQGLKVSMPAGYSIVSSIVPQAVTLGSIGFPVEAGDTVFFFNLATQSFDSYISLDNSGSNYLGSNPALPAEPTPAVGQAFFVQRTAPADWNRNFTVQ